MECHGSVSEFAAGDADGWYVAPGVVVWRVDGIDGASLWGHVTTSQVDIAFDVVREYLARAGDRPFHVISDLTAATSLDDAVYPRVSAHFAELLPRVTPRIRRHIVILPDSLIRVAVAGFLHLHGQHGWQIASGLPAAVADPIASRVTALVQRVRDADLVTALRVHRVADNLPAAAKSLGVAPRTLQRALRSAGTTFRALVEDDRIATACRLLEQDDLKVEAIARDVGFRSLSGFVRSFRRVNGCSPHEWRARSHDWRPRSEATG